MPLVIQQQCDCHHSYNTYMNFPQKYFEGQERQMRTTVIEKRQFVQGKGQYEQNLQQLRMEGTMWKKEKPKRDYQFSLEGVKTVRLLSKKETVSILSKESSRETTLRSNLQSFPQTQKPKIELGLQRLHNFIVEHGLRPFWNRIRQVFKLKNATGQRIPGKNMCLIQQDAAILYFPLLSIRLDDIKIAFFSKLQLHRRRQSKPYEMTIIYLIVRLQTRIRYTNLQRAMRALKE